MTDQTVILKVIPILSADGLSNLDSPGGGTRGGRTTETSNPTSKSFRGTSGSGVLGKFMAGVGFSPAAAGIAAAVNIMMQLMKDLFWAFKPVMSAVSAIAKMLGIIFVPVMQALMFLLIPILQILRPIMAMIRVIMKPFQDVIMRASRLMAQGLQQGDLMGASTAAFTGLVAMVYPLMELLSAAILQAASQLITTILNTVGGLLQMLGTNIGGVFGDLLYNAGTLLKAGASVITNWVAQEIASFSTDFNSGVVDVLNGTLDVVENNLSSMGIDAGQAGKDAIDSANKVITDAMIEDAGGFRTAAAAELLSFLTPLTTAFNDGILAPIDSFIAKLKKKADSINSIRVGAGGSGGGAGARSYTTNNLDTHSMDPNLFRNQSLGANEVLSALGNSNSNVSGQGGVSAIMHSYLSGSAGSVWH
jgi:hypothetical protein